jgi:threonine/homoserine/homoserine lactone efflux protein
MKRTAEYGRRAGVIAGLAIVLVDTIAATAIIFGLHHAFPRFSHFPGWFHLLGALIVFFYGFRILMSIPKTESHAHQPWHRHFLNTLVVIFTNPSTYFSFGAIGVFLIRLGDTPITSRIVTLVGFAIGATIWWWALICIAASQRERYFKKASIHKLIGGLIMALAIASLFFPTYREGGKRYSFIEKFR